MNEEMADTKHQNIRTISLPNTCSQLSINFLSQPVINIQSFILFNIGDVLKNESLANFIELLSNIPQHIQSILCLVSLAANHVHLCPQFQ